MTDLSELIGRVRQATGPDRELDIAIHSAISKPLPPGHVHGLVPRYTASLDAISALIEQKLPGWQYGIDHRRMTNGGPTAWLAPNENASRISAATPALALCLSFLLALHSQEQNSDQ